LVLLALESTALYEHLSDATEANFVNGLIQQFFHHLWNGLRFWDLIQPAFMFMQAPQWHSPYKSRDNTWQQSFRKILKTLFPLVFPGCTGLCSKTKGLSFELWDVLTQLSFTTLVAFSFSDGTIQYRSYFVLVCCYLQNSYTLIPIFPGFDQPFTDQHNLGNNMDLVLMNKINKGSRVAINCIPTAVHTIAGALAGKVLLYQQNKLNLFLWGVLCLASGYALDATGITPIIKRIATTSLTLASLGWCLFSLILCYWWIDIKDHRRHLKFFTIVGMNAIFIYLFFEIVGSRWFNGYIGKITNGLINFANIPEIPKLIITSLCISILEWLLCYFLYRKKIFFKL
jgi:predicted acyltransferase